MLPFPKRGKQCTEKAFAFSILNGMYCGGVIWFPSSSFKLICNIVYLVLKLGCYMGLWKDNRENRNKVSGCGLALAYFSELEAITRPASQLLQDFCGLLANIWLPHGLKAASLLAFDQLKDTVVWRIVLTKWVLLVLIWKTAQTHSAYSGSRNMDTDGHISPDHMPHFLLASIKQETTFQAVNLQCKRISLKCKVLHSSIMIC